jgi:very-short-patch-repair endonuclease
MSECLICNRLCKNNQSLGCHVKLHNMTSREYKEKFNLIKKCIKCGKELSKNNNGEFCNHCRDRSGSKNSFFRHKHTKEVVDAMKIKCVEITKELWKNEDYRNKVIKGVSKPRKESFKKEQSDRIKQWYIDNPEQREIRSIKMKESWETGKIVYNEHNTNRSKSEIEFFKDLENIISCKEKQVIKIGEKWYLPDIFISKDGIIIEYFGDFWHANPNIYKPDDIIHHEIKAQEIWNKDNERKGELEECGYKVWIIWESEFLKNKQQILKGIDNLLNWDTCSL